MPLTVHGSVVANQVLLRLDGELLASTVDLVLAAVDHAILTGHREVVVDLTDVSRLDPDGLRSLADGHDALSRLRGALTVRGSGAAVGAVGGSTDGADLDPVGGQ
jgi:anti-anti-sigma regulatory factor